ncbi:hypothetical protein [Eastern grey kangaroopox virus]|uniref:Uncharacterized protein n=1 Tax=Eastern grey kangaroopox virus TaxID=2042482 RepID=A0A2C9DTC2_9POXV|nr:hypothetical protein KM541_gp159 [Eastern grey kangaroopox virus]ATI21255.1 hypothetical protein [Eastern grey kangaroopox virus]ATX75161.1 hypothetical protein EKPV-NSW-ORF176 [Eastern grey kangaroopox virus]
MDRSLSSEDETEDSPRCSCVGDLMLIRSLIRCSDPDILPESSLKRVSVTDRLTVRRNHSTLERTAACIAYGVNHLDGKLRERSFMFYKRLLQYDVRKMQGAMNYVNSYVSGLFHVLQVIETNCEHDVIPFAMRVVSKLGEVRTLSEQAYADIVRSGELVLGNGWEDADPGEPMELETRLRYSRRLLLDATYDVGKLIPSTEELESAKTRCPAESRDRNLLVARALIGATQSRVRRTLRTCLRVNRAMDRYFVGVPRSVGRDTWYFKTVSVSSGELVGHSTDRTRYVRTNDGFYDSIEILNLDIFELSVDIY